MNISARRRLWTMAFGLLTVQAVFETVRAVQLSFGIWPYTRFMGVGTGAMQARIVAMYAESIFSTVVNTAAWWAIVALAWLLRAAILNVPAAGSPVSLSGPTDTAAWPPPPTILPPQ